MRESGTRGAAVRSEAGEKIGHATREERTELGGGESRHRTSERRFRARAAIRNDQMGFGGYVEYSSAQMPGFTQWKMMGAGDYVCGLEPSNAPLASRAELLEKSTMPILEPGETRSFDLEFGVLS